MSEFLRSLPKIAAHAAVIFALAGASSGALYVVADFATRGVVV